MIKMRDLLAGGLLASILVACSAATPTTPPDGSMAQTAGPMVEAAQTAVPGLEATAASGAGLAATAAPTVLPAAQSTVEAATGITADDLAATVGQSITVSGPVTRISDGMLFQLDDPAHGDVMVLAPAGSFSVAEGQRVEVTGIVAPFDPVALEQQLGINLDDSIVASLDSTTVIVAETVNPSTAD